MHVNSTCIARPNMTSQVHSCMEGHGAAQHCSSAKSTVRVCRSAGAEVWPAPAAVARAVQGTPSLEELKLQYYRLNIQFHQQEHNYLEICRCYRAIYDTPSIVADDTAWKQVRKCHLLATCNSFGSTK